jgi:hypothetical protein
MAEGVSAKPTGYSYHTQCVRKIGLSVSTNEIKGRTNFGLFDTPGGSNPACVCLRLKGIIETARTAIRAESSLCAYASAYLLCAQRRRLSAMDIKKLTEALGLPPTAAQWITAVGQTITLEFEEHSVKCHYKIPMPFIRRPPIPVPQSDIPSRLEPSAHKS